MHFSHKYSDESRFDRAAKSPHIACGMHVIQEWEIMSPSSSSQINCVALNFVYCSSDGKTFRSTLVIARINHRPGSRQSRVLITQR